MKFTPKSREELEAADLMPKGEYDAEILSAEETTSKTSGKPMFKVKLGVYDSRGRQQWVFDYIVCDTYKLPNIAKACGLFDRYESGELTADELAGRGVKVKIGIESADGDFPAKNKVNDYVYEKAAKAADASAAGAKSASKDPDPMGKDEDDIPF